MKPRSRRIVREVPTFNKILVATDFSEDSKYALSYAVEMAQPRPSKLPTNASSPSDSGSSLGIFNDGIAGLRVVD